MLLTVGTSTLIFDCIGALETRLTLWNNKHLKIHFAAGERICDVRNRHAIYFYVYFIIPIQQIVVAIVAAICRYNLLF